MPSQALAGLLQGLQEVKHLQRANPSPSGRPPANPPITRVIGRASVVLLYGHLERYVYALNEEAVTAVNALGPTGAALPEALRLRHSRLALDDTARTQWNHRAANLKAFIDSEGWLWATQPLVGALSHGRLIDWMVGVDPNSIRRLFQLWGISNIFEAVTRTGHWRSYFIYNLKTLAEKRHNIAHGELTETATQADVRQYRDAVEEFCLRADKALARQMASLLGAARPW